MLTRQVQPTSPQAVPQANATRYAALARTCAGACTSEQSTCSPQCDQGKMSRTDRATCKLTCESDGDMCRDDRRLEEAGCRGPTYR